MLGELRTLLEKAAGRSEFIIAVVCDIRGFSAFSTSRESPDTAMFIKRVYLQLLDNHFPSARFVKPTGDGLLLVFQYDEATLSSVSATVLEACVAAMSAFPTMFANDPMINYPTPTNLGFGIARGTACCLFADDTLLDYSGQILNLASRLNDLARPRGLVVDGQYLATVIPESLRPRFRSEQVYIRGIAEETPRQVLCLTPEVLIPDTSRFPLSRPLWRLHVYKMSVTQLGKVGGRFNIPLPEEPRSPSDVAVELRWPNPKLKGYSLSLPLTQLNVVTEPTSSRVGVTMSEVHTIIANNKISKRRTMEFVIRYVPKRAASP